MQREIAESSYKYQQEVESGERIVVGVNKFQVEEPPSIKVTKLDDTGETRQLKRLNKLRKERDNEAVKRSIKELKEAAQEGVNLVIPVKNAVKTYVTIGEICGVLREIWGEYKPKGLW